MLGVIGLGWALKGARKNFVQKKSEGEALGFFNLNFLNQKNLEKLFRI